ncbi:DUF881 domain-containing protein [Mycobacterium sp. CBMA271]|nr:DUF881 domain-containing protein [Mycobacteroides sp. CBMA 271]
MNDAQPEPHDLDRAADSAAHPGKHEMPKTRRPPTRSQITFGVLGVALCALLGLAITTQVRQTESGDGLDAARPADLLVLLDSLQQRDATLNKEIADLQQSLITMRASGTGNQAVINDAKARLSALSIMVGTVGATGPGVVLTINDPGQGLGPEALLDIINELRAAGAEAIEIKANDQSVRIGADSWVTGAPGQLTVDRMTLSPPYSLLAIGDPPTLAAAMNIPGGAVDTVSRVGGSVTIDQPARVDITTLREPKPRQYAQPGK